jgi:hypothetical protein
MKVAGKGAPQTPLERWRSRAAFIYRKFVVGYRVSGESDLDDRAAAHFAAVLARTSHYLEYGSGGSTVMAWQTVKTLVSVENDRRFHRAVTRFLAGSAPGPTRSTIIYANTGITKQWGFPLFKTPTGARLHRWQQYVLAPWTFLNAHGIQPDTILVDGRFRVACVLESLLNLQDGSPCSILVDDYVHRPEYGIVEAFADHVSTHGQMVEVRKKPDFDRPACVRALPDFQRDWR